MKNLSSSLLTLALSTLFLSSCQEDENIQTSNTVSGTAVKGILQHAKVDVYQ